MCFGGGDSSSSGSSSASARADVTFNPSITIGSNEGEPVADTPSTFAAKLLSAPPVRIALDDERPSSTDKGTNSTTNVLLFVAVALAARKVLRR